MKSSKPVRMFLNKVFIRNLLLIAVTVFGLMYLSGFAGIYQVVQDRTFAEGVSVDGIDVSHMTYDQAAQTVMANAQERLEKIQIDLIYNDVTVTLEAGDLGVTLNSQMTLDQAYSYNKNEADSHAQRFDKTVELLEGKDFDTQLVIDKSVLKRTTEEYVSEYNTAAENASAEFNAATGQFTYTKEKSGIYIDANEISDTILEMLRTESYSPINVPADTIEPSVTESMLKENTVPTGQYETTADINKNRNINIQLMCNAINGLEIKPHKTLSLNELVGERTEKKGFMPAPAIENGVIVDQIGGGICQLAGTLYNAALISDMEIVERVRHTWPSNYLPIGQDATLNWDDKDLIIKNKTDFSIFISASFLNQKVTVKLFGKPLEKGMTIEIKNDIIKELSPGKTEVRYTSDLPNDVRQTIRKAKNGYVVNVYRIYKKSGIEVERELISQDTYPAVNKLVFIGRNTSDK